MSPRLPEAPRRAACRGCRRRGCSSSALPGRSQGRRVDPGVPEDHHRLWRVEVEHRDRARKVRHGNGRKRWSRGGQPPEHPVEQGPSSAGVISPTTATRRWSRVSAARARRADRRGLTAATDSSSHDGGGHRDARERPARRKPCGRAPGDRHAFCSIATRVCPRSRSRGSGSNRGSVRASRSRSIARPLLAEHRREDRTQSSSLEKRYPRREVLTGGGEGGEVESPAPWSSSAAISAVVPLTGRVERRPTEKARVDGEDRDVVVLVEPGLDASWRGYLNDVDFGPRRRRARASPGAMRELGCGSLRHLGRRSPAASASRSPSFPSGTLPAAAFTSSAVTDSMMSGHATTSSSVSPDVSAPPTRMARPDTSSRAKMPRHARGL